MLELVLNQLLEVIVGKLAGIFFKNRLCGLCRWHVKQHDCRHILSERFLDAGELLGQHPFADASVTCQKAKLDQLPGPPFHVFRGCTVIKDYESVQNKNWPLTAKIPAMGLSRQSC